MHEFGRAWRARFRLEPGVDFLNHGSFGAAPLEVLDAAARWREQMEANPDRFLRQALPDALRNAARELARFVHASGDDLVFVENATSAVNAVLRSLEFTPGDEILINSQSYGAVRQAVRYVCERSGAKAIEPHVAIPVSGSPQLLPAITGRTRLLIVDHISSPTGLVWPVKEIVAAARERGVRVLVDGAHAPGQLDLDVPALGADWYTGNCHKWLYAPRGCAFLWSDREHQSLVHPLPISHGYGSGYIQEFDWPGTRDFSPWLAAGAGIRFLQELGADAVRRYCRELAASAADKIAQAWRQPLAGPPALHASMMAIRLPDACQQAGATRDTARRLQSEFMDRHRIAVAIMAIDGVLWARISAQVYNGPEDYDRLIEAGLR
ncbi:MAG TPA: aminotransferase class V-fold PLP-dependent enzyme [Burkholderiales bacterium]|nr:aminotransferase class V-fold PLP-dependent enzyme [Burkholderiales bacterium]